MLSSQWMVFCKQLSLESNLCWAVVIQCSSLQGPGFEEVGSSLHQRTVMCSMLESIVYSRKIEPVNLMFQFAPRTHSTEPMLFKHGELSSVAPGEFCIEVEPWSHESFEAPAQPAPPGGFCERVTRSRRRRFWPWKRNWVAPKKKKLTEFLLLPYL